MIINIKPGGLAKAAPLTAALVLAASGAQAALIVAPTNDITALANAVLGASSGITLIGGSPTLIGADSQQGTYSGSLVPTNAAEPTYNLPSGIVLTTGSAGFSNTTNTSNNFSVNSGTGSYAPLVTLASTGGLNTSQSNANVLSFDFTVDDLSLNSISAQFLFATDEYPTQSVTDIMGIFVNGVNFAFFPNGDLVSNQSGDPNSFFNLNPVGSGLYPIEWNGLTQIFNVVGLINPGAVNTISFAISDTSDTIFDSALFVGGMKAGFTTGGGGIGDPDPTDVPEPLSLTLLGLGLAGLVTRRRRRTI